MSQQNIVIIRNAAPQDFGGGERFPVFLSQVLVSKGLAATIISRSKSLLHFADENNIKTVKGWWWKRQNWSGINNLFIPIYIGWQVILFIYYVYKFLVLKPTAIHIQSKDDFIAATYAGKLLNKHVIWTDHADLKHVWKNITVWYKNPIGKMVYRAAQYADTITVVSQSEYTLVTENLPATAKFLSNIKVIYNGIVDSISQYERQPTTSFTFLVASRLVQDKGIHEVIEAFQAFNKRHPESTLKIIGDGPEKHIFEEKIKNISAVELLGYQPEPLNFMASADVFVHPTYHEGFSVALVEASMMSLPIIATAVGGNVEIIENNKTGLLVPAKNPDALIEAMETLFTNSKLRASLAINARNQYLARYQFDQIIENEFIPLYRSSS